MLKTVFYKQLYNYERSTFEKVSFSFENSQSKNF